MKATAIHQVRSRGLSAALIGAVSLAYELALMRIFSITQWHHFAYMIISIAMLGVGSAGTVLSLVKLKSEAWFKRLAIAFAFSMPGCHILSQFIPFETFHLVGNPMQLTYLFVLYLILSLPFFLGAAFVTLALQLHADQIGTLYGFNMAGSAFGAFGGTLLLYVFPASVIPALMGAVVFAAQPGASVALASAMGKTLPWRTRGMHVLLFGVMLILCTLSLGIPLRVSQYKSLSMTLHFPDSRIVARARSPMSDITAVSSRLIRETPGQLSGYPMGELGEIPEQIALFFDAGSISVINRFDGNLSRFAYLDYVTAALPYHLISTPRVLVAGAGGGSDVLMALRSGSESVTALEVDPCVFSLIEHHFSAFSGGLYQRPDVYPVQEEARRYLTRTPEQYDLIHISLIDAFSASSAGVYALSENYLYTKEALQTYVQRLTSTGILSITRWIKTPARDTIKLFATAVEALEDEGVVDPGTQLLWIRSWNSATVLLSRSPWTAAQVETAYAFCQQRSLDLCYAPGLQIEQANQYTILPTPVYYDAAKALLSPRREDYYQDYLFHIEPATDNSPYFFRFFKWSSIGRLLSGMGTEWIPFVEWGYLALLATWLQGSVAALICIVLPLLVFRKSREMTALPSARSIFYFGGAGAAYMFLEIFFIQKIMLFLAYPVYAVSVELAAFLLFSGLGAAWGVKRIAENRKVYRFCMAGLLGSLIISVLAVELLTPALMTLPEWGCIAAALILPAPPAFFMGIPFPAGLRQIGHQEPRYIPWAWGTNGLLSVIAAPSAMLIAMHAGLPALVGTAGIIYFLIALQFRHLLPSR